MIGMQSAYIDYQLSFESKEDLNRFMKEFHEYNEKKKKEKHDEFTEGIINATIKYKKNNQILITFEFNMVIEADLSSCPATLDSPAEYPEASCYEEEEFLEVIETHLDWIEMNIYGKDNDNWDFDEIEDLPRLLAKRELINSYVQDEDKIFEILDDEDERAYSMHYDY